MALTLTFYKFSVIRITIKLKIKSFIKIFKIKYLNI